MKVNYVSIPPPGNNENPFLGLLSKWLAQNGWQRHEFNFNIPNLMRNKKKVEVYYFHWPESIWRSNSLMYSYIKAIYFILNCSIAKIMGYKLIWSAHNKLPHGFRSYKLEVFLRKFIIRKFHLIIGHSSNTFNDLQTIGAVNFEKKYVFAAHGFYEDIYQPANIINRANAGIGENKIVMLLKASEKDYQGTDTVLKYIKNNSIPPAIHFLIFGIAHTKIVEELRNTCIVSFYEGKVSDPEMADLMLMSDFVLMPYTSITTSGFYFLAMTFHKPVIAPGINFFKENSLPGTVLLYPFNQIDKGLNNIFDDIISNRWKKAEADFELLEKEYNWKLSSQKIAEAYQHAITH